MAAGKIDRTCGGATCEARKQVSSLIRADFPEVPGWKLQVSASHLVPPIRVYQNLLSGKSDAFEPLEEVPALEKLSVTESTLAER